MFNGLGAVQRRILKSSKSTSKNCSPCDIKLERGSTIATVESEWEDQIQEFDGKQVDNFINDIRETTSKIQK